MFLGFCLKSQNVLSPVFNFLDFLDTSSGPEVLVENVQKFTFLMLKTL